MRAQLDKLAALLEEFDVDVVLVANPENVEYFTGVRSIAEPQALLVARRGGTVTLYTTLLDYYRYERLEGLGVEVRAVTSSARRPPDAKVFEGSWKELVGRLAEGSKVGLDAQYASPLSAILAEALGGRSVDVSKVIRSMRMIKESWEVELIREAARITSKAIEDAVEQVVEGVTEAELAGIFEASARKAGIDEFAFQSIVASKPSNSFPHVYPGLKRVRARDLVLFDVGVKVGGRCSDVTRMVVLGRPEDEEERALRAVEEALDAALERLAPGAKARDVHDVAVKVLEKHGLERHFIHGLGHGVGLAVHEPPYIREGSEDVLEPGMVVTIEPGVYFPNRFGVRIEEDVLITERGHEVITGSLQRIFRV